MEWLFDGSVGIEQIFVRNIRQKQYSQFPPVHGFAKAWWGVAYVPCMTNLRSLYAWAIRWHVTGILSLAAHWQGRRTLSNHVCVHSAISMLHVVCLQHLVRARSEQSRSTSVLPYNHLIQMPQCLSGLVNHDYCMIGPNIFKPLSPSESTPIKLHIYQWNIYDNDVCYSNYSMSQCVGFLTVESVMLRRQKNCVLNIDQW